MDHFQYLGGRTDFEHQRLVVVVLHGSGVATTFDVLESILNFSLLALRKWLFIIPICICVYRYICVYSCWELFDAIRSSARSV